MGKGRLKRVAAHVILATLAVFSVGAIQAPALGLPGVGATGPSVAVPATPVTVPSTTVRVPSTNTTVTTPAVKAPAVKTPAPKPAAQVTKPVADTVRNTTSKVTNTVGSVGTKAGGAVSKGAQTMGNTTSKATGGGSGGGGSSRGGSSGGDLVAGTVGSILGGVKTTTGMVRRVGGTSARGGSLAEMLAGASALQFRAVLEELEGCIPVLPLGERRVISMRAGLDGAAPLSRRQVATRLGISRNAVRRTERRALGRLQYAANTTGCAASVGGPFDPVGVGSLVPRVLFAGAVPVAVKDAVVAGDPAAASGPARPGSALIDLRGTSKSGPAWLIVMFTVLLSVSIAALTRELRSNF